MSYVCITLHLSGLNPSNLFFWPSHQELSKSRFLWRLFASLTSRRYSSPNLKTLNPFNYTMYRITDELMNDNRARLWRTGGCHLYGTPFFSGRELKLTFAICHRASVCLSVCNVGAPYSAGCNFRQFFFQAEDGIRDAQESRGLGDVYKRQVF